MIVPKELASLKSLLPNEKVTHVNPISVSNKRKIIQLETKNRINKQKNTFIAKIYSKPEQANTEIFISNFFNQVITKNKKFSLTVSYSKKQGIIIFKALPSKNMWLTDILLNNCKKDTEKALLLLAKEMAKFHINNYEIIKNSNYASILKKEKINFPNTEFLLRLCAEKLRINTDIEQISKHLLNITTSSNFITLVHRDLCTDNITFDSYSANLIDFEHTCLGSFAIDEVVFEIGLPPCSLCGSIPEDLIRSMKEAYLDQLKKTPSINLSINDWERERILAKLYWLLQSIIWLLTNDENWGSYTRSSRIIFQIQNLKKNTSLYLPEIEPFIQELEKKLDNYLDKKVKEMQHFPALS